MAIQILTKAEKADRVIMRMKQERIDEFMRVWDIDPFAYIRGYLARPFGFDIVEKAVMATSVFEMCFNEFVIVKEATVDDCIDWANNGNISVWFNILLEPGRIYKLDPGVAKTNNPEYFMSTMPAYDKHVVLSFIDRIQRR